MEESVLLREVGPMRYSDAHLARRDELEPRTECGHEELLVEAGSYARLEIRIANDVRFQRPECPGTGVFLRPIPALHRAARTTVGHTGEDGASRSKWPA